MWYEAKMYEHNHLSEFYRWNMNMDFYQTLTYEIFGGEMINQNNI